MSREKRAEERVKHLLETTKNADEAPVAAMLGLIATEIAALSDATRPYLVPAGLYLQLRAVRSEWAGGAAGHVVTLCLQPDDTTKGTRWLECKFNDRAEALTHADAFASALGWVRTSPERDALKADPVTWRAP